ncbi:hypothetical protein B0H13DRAFT_308633, partial [Mycena leptocephala]
MPLFTSASGVQINGGNFIDIAGDVNLHNLQPAIAQNSDPLSATQSRRLLGMDRNTQNGGARLVPYDASRRPQILSSASGQIPQEESWSNSAVPIQLLSNLPPFTFAQPQYSPSFFEPGPQRPPVINYSPDNGSIGTSGFEYPLSNVLTPGEYGHTSPINHHHPSIIYPSSHLQPLAGLPGEPAHLFTGDFRNDEPESSIAAINCTQWGGLPQEPKTNINIGGNLNHIQRHGEAGRHILYRAAAGDATHDSEDRFPQPRCHPETRTKMLDVLRNWACGIEPPKTWNDDESSESSSEDEDISSSSKDEDVSSSSDDKSSPILWLHGPAGAGKSAIAQTLCQKLEEEGRLGASFFFKREHPSRGHAKRLFATIAYQLALVVPDLNRHISQSVETNPSLVDKSLSTQLRKLIVEPCRQNTSTRAPVVVIDGLDECADQTVQQEILCSIGRAVTEQQLPLRFLIASRPESHIREIFTRALNNIHCPLNVHQSFEDVQKYLCDEFARIHRDHWVTMARVPYPWPTPKTINNLVYNSSGYFIYASTIIKFVDDKNFRPTERLEIITGITEPLSELPFASLDQLYIQILSQVAARPQLLRILTVIAARIDLSPAHIEQLLELEQGDLRLALRGLHSVISGLEKDNSDDPRRLNFHHASFRDFLQDPRRAGIFYVGGYSHRMDFSHCILKAFSYRYQDPVQNRCGHVSRYLGIPAFELVVSSEPSSTLISLLHSFNPDFLFHFAPEVVIAAVDMVLEWLKQNQPLATDLIQLWEAYHFMAYYERVWYQGSGRENQVTEEDRGHCHQILSQVSPSLLRILQTIKFITYPAYHPYYHPEALILKIHALLNFSWDELRMAFCSLRSLIGYGEEGLIRNMPIVAFDMVISPAHLLWDLACSCLRVMRRILSGEMDKIFERSLLKWSYHLRWCPPSPQLLQELCDVEPVLAGSRTLELENYNILEWLKTFSPPPLELIGRVEHYLDEPRQRWPELTAQL